MPPYLCQICRTVAAGLVLCVALSGCAVQQLSADHDKIRTALLDLYTNQIIDNLIRASNGLPIIQLDYSNATAVITVLDTESLTDSVATTATKATTTSLSPTLTNASTSGTTATMSATPSTVATMMATVTNVLASGLSTVATHGVVNTAAGAATHSNSNQVALTATPVTTSNDVYDAYLYFLGLPGSLQATCDPPEEGQAIICRRVGKTFYWVPIEFRKDFFNLSLQTTAQRGMPVGTPQAWDVTILGVKGTPENLKREGKNVYVYNIVINKKVPNFPGTAVIDSVRLDFEADKPPVGPQPSMTYTLQLYVDFDPQDDPSKPGSKILKVPLKATTPDMLTAAFETQMPKASLFIKGHPPEAPTTVELLERVNFNLQQVQFNQLRGANP
jgi:hypothetical protein